MPGFSIIAPFSFSELAPLDTTELLRRLSASFAAVEKAGERTLPGGRHWLRSTFGRNFPLDEVAHWTENEPENEPRRWHWYLRFELAQPSGQHVTGGLRGEWHLCLAVRATDAEETELVFEAAEQRFIPALPLLAAAVASERRKLMPLLGQKLIAEPEFRRGWNVARLALDQAEPVVEAFVVELYRAYRQSQALKDEIDTPGGRGRKNRPTRADVAAQLDMSASQLQARLNRHGLQWLDVEALFLQWLAKH